MKDSKDEDFDLVSLKIFKTSINISRDACEYYENSFGELSEKGKLELYIFSLFYSWKYLEEERLIILSTDNAKMFITAGFIKFEKRNDDLKMGEFIELFIDRKDHHDQELETILEKTNENEFYYPSYFFTQVEEDEELKYCLEEDGFVEETEHTSEEVERYNSLVNYMKTQLDRSFRSDNGSTKMKDTYLITIRSQMETRIRTFLIDSQQNNKDFPEIMQGLMLRSDASIYSKNLKLSYPELKDSFNRLNENFDLSELEYNTIVDEITLRVLGEFIDINEENSEDDGSDLPF